MGHGTTKIEFLKRDGTKSPLTIDNDLKEILDEAKKRNRRNWDYVAILAGLPGSGKTTLAKNTLAPYCSPWFCEKYIAFTADQFIEITTKCREYSAVILDESFAPLNSKSTFTPEFLRIVNHLQLIRTKRLFIFLCLPNYFDLAKGIAIFRSSHLFVPWEDEKGNRGNFSAFGRREKRELYVLGSKFMDYQSREPNFHGRFYKNGGIIEEDVYEELKQKHLKNQNKKLMSVSVEKFNRDIIIYTLNTKYKLKHEEIGQMFKLTRSGVTRVVNRVQRHPNLGEILGKSSESA